MCQLTLQKKDHGSKEEKDKIRRIQTHMRRAAREESLVYAESTTVTSTTISVPSFHMPLCRATGFPLPLHLLISELAHIRYMCMQCRQNAHTQKKKLNLKKYFNTFVKVVDDWNNCLERRPCSNAEAEKSNKNKKCQK